MTGLEILRPAVYSPRTMDDELTYGKIYSGAELLIAASMPRQEVTQQCVSEWEELVAAWATHLDPEANYKYDTSLGMPEDTVEKSVELGLEAVRIFANQRLNDNEQNAVSNAVAGATNDFFPDEWYIGRNQMSYLLSEAVVSPAVTIIRYRFGLMNLGVRT